MAKSALPLIVGAGAAVFLLMPKKKKTPVVKKNGNGNGNGTKTDPNIVMSGTKSEWGWRVRKEPGQPGFADRYFGEVKDPAAALTWETVHDTGRSKPDEAKLLAWERIAQELADEASQTFNWEPARAHNEGKLREQYPDASLSVLDTGSMSKNGVKCNWAIMDVLPPIEPGAYAGFVICPKTNEQISRFGNSIASIKQVLEIT